MLKIEAALVAALLLLLPVAAFAGGGATPDYSLWEQRAEVLRLQREVAQDQVAETEAQRRALQTQLTVTQKALEDLRNWVQVYASGMEAQLADTKGELANTKQQLDALRAWVGGYFAPADGEP